jgi:hypothetical protein
MAWRNVWRNPRRTGLTLAATVFAVVLVMFSVAMAAGTHEKMIEDSVRVNAGHVQVSGPGYLEKRTLEQFVVYDDALARRIDATPGVEGHAPRILSFGLLSRDSSTRGVAVVGIDPSHEATVTTLPDRVREGAFLSPHGRREMCDRRRGAALRDRVLAGDRLRPVPGRRHHEAARGQHGPLARVRVPARRPGILRLRPARQRGRRPGPGLGRGVCRGGRPARRPRRGRRRGPHLARGDARARAAHLPRRRRHVHPARDPRGRGRLQFGVVLALGLRPAAIFRVVYLESMLLALVGLALGLALAFPLVLYFEAHPIAVAGDAVAAAELLGMEPQATWKLKPMNPIGSVLTVLGVALVAALYPALKASRGRPVDVLRSL